MVVPQPAVIQHGDASQLGMLAYLAGRARRRPTPQYIRSGDVNAPNAAFQRATAAPTQQAQGARVIYGGRPGLEQAVASGRTVVNPQARREELEALKQAQAQRRAQTPTDGRARSRQSPLVQDLMGRDRTGFGAIAGPEGVHAITAEDEGTTLGGESVAAARDMADRAGLGEQFGEALTGLEQGQAAGGGVTQAVPQDQGLSTQAQTKLAYAELSGMGQLPESQQRAIQQIILDEGVDVQQARLMMDRVAERALGPKESTGLSPRQAAQMQVHELRREESRLRDQAEEIAEQYSATERAMTVQEFEQSIDEITGDQSRIPFYWGEGITEEQAEQRKQEFRRFKELEQEAETLQQERRRRIGIDGGGGGQNIPAPAIQMLREDPSAEARREFDEVFGEGAAAQVLNK